MTDYELDPRNARTHSDEQKNSVQKSLDELGAGRSIVVDADGKIIGGNAVYEQAEKLGIPVKEIETSGDELVVVRRVDLNTDDPRRKALALADNQIATLAGWDEVQLEELQSELLGEVEFETMGFDEPEPEEAVQAIEPINTPGVLDASDAEVDILDGKEAIVVYFSGGRDSTCSLLWASHNAGGKDVIPIYCDMGVEHPAMSTHCRRVCEGLELELVVVKPEEDFWAMLEREGWPHFRYPWCQHKMLYPTLNAMQQSLGYADEVSLRVGAAATRSRRDILRRVR